MSRWQPNARERLESAALELFIEHGFAATTVPQITAHAGLTTRTFFRHFVDKREVLFAADDDFPALVSHIVSQAPPSLSPVAVFEAGIDALAAEMFEGRLEFLRARHMVVRSDEGLAERELSKRAAMADAITRAYLDRGVDQVTAALTAQFTMAVVGVSVGRWIGENGATPLPHIMRETLQLLRAIAAD